MKKLQKQHGQAAVEFALILPLFLMLVFAITEFGRLWMTQHALATASRTGCRKAILPTSTESDVVQTVNTFCAAASLDTDKVTVSSSNVGIDGTSGNPTQVTVSYPFSVLSGSIIPALQGTIVLSSTTTMRHE